MSLTFATVWAMEVRVMTGVWLVAVAQLTLAGILFVFRADSAAAPTLALLAFGAVLAQATY